MRGILRGFMVIAAVAVSTACVKPMSQNTPAAPSANGTTRALHALFDAEGEHDLAESPIWASSIGDRRYDTKWDDVSLAAQARREAHERMVFEKIERLDRS